MSIHSPGNGYGTHDSSIVFEERCPDCQLDHATTLRLLREEHPAMPEARKAAILDAVRSPRPPWWRRPPGWLAALTLAGLVSSIALLGAGVAWPAWPVVAALVAALSGHAFGAAARWRARRQ